MENTTLILAIIAAATLGCIFTQMIANKTQHDTRQEQHEQDATQQQKHTKDMDTKDNTTGSENTENTENTQHTEDTGYTKSLVPNGTSRETRKLAIKLLQHLNCSPEDEEYGRIKFSYQGIYFLLEASDDCLFVTLIWPWCHSFSKFDIDEFSRVRQVINDINSRGTSTVFYGISDSDEVAVHVKCNFLLVSEIPDLQSYFKLEIDDLFRTARALELEVERNRMEASQGS